MERVSIIGIGRLGLCTALCIERAGYKVLGVDIFPDYVEKLNTKTFTSSEPRVTEFLLKSTNFRASTNIFEAIDFADILIILVDTPSNGGVRHYDTRKVASVLSSINMVKPHNKHIVIGCTVMPGYIREVGRELVRDCVNCSLSYNPEFIQQGNIIHGFLNPDIVLIGEGCREAGDFLERMYTKVVENEPSMCRMSAESAEITKIAINCFITTKISFANMIGDIADRTPGADKFEILRAVGKDSRIGSKCLIPGYGYGGPCFPRDNRALGGYARSVGIEPVIPDGTDKYNMLHARYQIEDFIKQDKSMYIFEDVAYKSKCPVPIIEESQKLVVAHGVAKLGKAVIIKDRPFIIDAVRAEYGSIFSYETSKE